MPAAPEASGSGANAKGAGTSLGDLYSTCVQLVNENKISTKNAFDLHLIDRMDDIVESFMGGRKSTKRSANSSKEGGGRQSVGGGEDRRQSSSQEDVEESRFHEASCTIEASARIYACRVDCVHTDTYRVLGGLNSADLGDEEEGGNGEEGKPGDKKRRRIVGVNTLERNENNITQQHLEADEMSDPMFRRMAAAFDAGGAKGLLLGHLPIAEDLSLVFNGDVPISRASGEAGSLFSSPLQLLPGELGLGKDPSSIRAKLDGAQLCPGLDKFRRELYGSSADLSVTLPKELQNLLSRPDPAAAATPAPLGAPGSLQPLQDVDGGADDVDMQGGSIVPYESAEGQPQALGPDGGLPDGELQEPFGVEGADGSLPLEDVELALKSCEPLGGTNDVIAFDELFEKFCGSGGKHQFAYFDDCWSKTGKDGRGAEMGVLMDGPVEDGDAMVARANSSGAAPGAQPEVREKAPKKPIFDLASLDQPLKPIETEAAHKHQLSERAAQWQLHKDVPPYMIDRITMPSWPTWSKCDFACLGLRPHLMLKLVKKPPPQGEGPHGFSDLFSTVVVENPDVLPWLSGADARRGAGHADEADRVAAPADAALFENADADEDFDGSGLPAHLDVNPEELFLRPDDHVIPGAGADAADGAEGGEDADGGDATGYAPDIDFELVDQPAVVGSTDIGYSRNSKFVDVKLVKKHLWDCIENDIDDARAVKKDKAASSFQHLVSRTIRKMPKSECENLSVAVCFICALHLCNEKNLELKTLPDKPMGDFAVVGATAEVKKKTAE